MNQILVTEKLYVTPELRRKKKMYKINLIISIIIIVILFSIYAYASYDRNKQENISQDILASMGAEDDTTISKDDSVWVIALDGEDESNLYTASETEEHEGTITDEYIAPNGKKYKMVGRVQIPKINVDYPILSETTDSLLKVSVCKFWGSNPNEVGNLCIAGHNYRNKKFFSKVPTLKVGDTIEVTDLSNQTLSYAVYDMYTVSPTDVSCTTQRTNGKKIVTLITCTNDSKQRIVVKAEEI